MASKVPPYFAFVVLSIASCIWISRLEFLPLWTDGVITSELVKARSLHRLFSAVLIGLDATPPLYTGYGLIMLRDVVPGATPESVLRVTNLVCAGLTIWLLYRSVRYFFDRATATVTTSAFVYLEKSQLGFLVLEVRTYALFVLSVTLAVYFALDAVSRRSPVAWIWLGISYCFLVCSHSFGIIYAICIGLASIVAQNGKGKLAIYPCLAMVPALLISIAWLPVLVHQTKLGNWIDPPNLQTLIDSTYSPNKIVFLLPPAATILLVCWWRSSVSVKSSISWPQISGGPQKLVVLLILLFSACTLAIWIVSAVFFPVFVPRYFYPNVILHIVWIALLVHLTFRHIILSPDLKFWFSIALPLLAATSITIRPYSEFNRVPCFDPVRRVYLEDEFTGDNTIVALGPHTWLTRLNRPRPAVFAVDNKIPRTNRIYFFNTNYVSAFASWLNRPNAVKTSKDLLSNDELLVLDDNNGPWLKFMQQNQTFELTKLATTTGCTLWKAMVHQR